MRDYDRSKTAITRNTLSVPMRYLIDNKLVSTDEKILDYGCGKGNDVKLLNGKGYDIKGYDKYCVGFDDLDLLSKQYDIITCNYVFNVIPSILECKELLEQLKNIANVLYIAVRTDNKAIKSNWIYEGDNLGYWTPRGTFQRFYDNDMARCLFKDCEIIKSNNSFIILKIV